MSDILLEEFEHLHELLLECRKFIDNIVPGCAAGHDVLVSLKRRIDNVDSFEPSKLNYLGELGLNESNETHFGEQYYVTFKNESYVMVHVWIRHGDHEKEHHMDAINVCNLTFPELTIVSCRYC